jgi:hypothetical protein
VPVALTQPLPGMSYAPQAQGMGDVARALQGVGQYIGALPERLRDTGAYAGPVLTGSSDTDAQRTHPHIAGLRRHPLLRRLALPLKKTFEDSPEKCRVLTVISGRGGGFMNNSGAERDRTDDLLSAISAAVSGHARISPFVSIYLDPEISAHVRKRMC